MSYCVIDIVDIVVGLLLVVLSRVEARGCLSYRGSAAEISVAKYSLRLKC